MMDKFGGMKKIYVSNEARKIFIKLCDKEGFFPQYVDLFHFAAALGLKLNKRKSVKNKQEFTNIYSIDTDGVFETILEQIHPDTDGKERLKLLQEYAEAGIQILKDRYDNEKRIDLEEIIEEMQTR